MEEVWGVCVLGGRWGRGGGVLENNDAKDRWIFGVGVTGRAAV